MVWTVAFAVVGVGIGATAGFLLAIVFPRFAAVRVSAMVLRSIHELFWALLLIQVFGLGPATGVLAIAIPYAGIFAKVFAEMIEEADLTAERVLPNGTSVISAFAFARLPELAERFKTYTLYRLECGLRSTLVLGFVGLPTVGFHLEGYFKQGKYAEAAALLGVFYVLIGTRRLWARPATVPLLIVGSLLVLPEAIGGGSTLANLARFLFHDIVPAPLRSGDVTSLATWGAFAAWLNPIIWNKIVPGAWQTFVLAQISLVGMGILALVLFPLVSRRFAGPIGQPAGRVLLVIVRSTPEYMLAYVLLQLMGPSMLPAIIALAVHNGAIVGYLMGRHADTLDHRPDAPARPQPLCLRHDAPALRAVSRLLSLSLGDHRARECDLRHSGRGNARLLRRCGDLRASLRCCHGLDTGDGRLVRDDRCPVAPVAAGASHLDAGNTARRRAGKIGTENRPHADGTDTSPEGYRAGRRRALACRRAAHVRHGPDARRAPHARNAAGAHALLRHAAGNDRGTLPLRRGAHRHRAAQPLRAGTALPH